MPFIRKTSNRVKFKRKDREAGDTYELICPNCGSTVLWAPYGWWKAKCDCGYEWRVQVRGLGIKWREEK